MRVRKSSSYTVFDAVSSESEIDACHVGCSYGSRPTFHPISQAPVYNRQRLLQQSELLKHQANE